MENTFCDIKLKINFWVLDHPGKKKVSLPPQNENLCGRICWWLLLYFLAIRKSGLN